MKAYIIPRMEIVKLETEDIITTSGGKTDECSPLDSWICSGFDGGGIIECDDDDDWGGM